MKYIIEKLRIEFNPERYLKDKINSLNEYFNSNNIKEVLVLVSGGIDSAVTLSILNHTNINVNAVFIDIDNSNWAKKNIKKLSKKEKLEIKIVDHTKIFHNFIQNINKNSDNDIYKNYPIKCILRDATKYYIKLHNKGLLVATTLNKDEVFLEFYCDNGCGHQEIPVITDIYKSEVYKLAKFLKIPKCIIDQEPSADHFPNQKDIDDLELDYDFVELYQYYLNMKNKERFEFINSLNKKDRNIFFEKEEKIKSKKWKNN